MMRLGYACINLSLPGNFRTCTLGKLKEFGVGYLEQIVYSNFIRLRNIIDWNIHYGIYVYRLSSEMVPFGGHELLSGWEWWEDERIKKLTEEIRDKVKTSGMRISIHPGPFNSLSTPYTTVLENCYRDLNYQKRLLGTCGGRDMILHVGGKYEGKTASLKRFKENFKGLPEKIQEVIRLENDHRLYTMEDVLGVCYDLNIKPMFDYHHNICSPSLEIEEIKNCLFDLWKGQRIKIHLSSGATHKRDIKHADYISRETYNEFMNDFGDCDIDVMLEAKKKNIAVFKMNRYLGGSEE